LVKFETDIEGASERALALFLTKARRAVGLRGIVNVVVTTNRAMRGLNRRFRAKDKPTDVLSFPAFDPTLPAGRISPPLRVAGDIAISGQMATANGRRLGHGTAGELKVLVLHGVLHLAGFDHENDRGSMARKEQELRRELKLPDGLIERAETPLIAKTISRPAQKPRGTRSDNGKSKHSERRNR